MADVFETDRLLGGKPARRKYVCPTYKRWLQWRITAVCLMFASLMGIIGIGIYFLIQEPTHYLIPAIFGASFCVILMVSIVLCVWLHYVEPK